MELFEQWRRQTWKDKHKKRKAIAIQNAERIRDRFMGFCDLEAGKILEIGCGSGAIRSSPLWRSDLEYWGLDPIILDPSHYQFPFIAGFAEHLPFKDRSFTQVLVKDSLDHFNNIEQFCNQTHRVLSAGGYLIIGQLLKANSSTLGCELSSHPLARIIRGFRALLFGKFDDFMDGFKRNLKIGGKRVSAEETHLWHFTEEEIEKMVRHHFQIQAKELIDGYLLIRAQRP